MNDKPQPEQPTQPKRGEPVEIPVPKREDVLRDLAKVAPRAPPGPSVDKSDDD